MVFRLRWPVWIERNGRVYYVGRDLRGHFTSDDTIEEPCPHPCCAGARHAPVTVRRTQPSGWDYEAERSSPAPWRTAAKESPTERRARAKRALDYDYAMYLHAHYLAAEHDTRGYMVTPAARARGISGEDFFRVGRRPSVEKWGSDEMKAWFETRDRTGTRHILSRTEFAASTKAHDAADAARNTRRAKAKTKTGKTSTRRRRPA